MARHKSHLTTKTRLRIEPLENRRVPTTLIPTTFADGGLGSGSLRDAVLQFNADSGTEDDTIQLLAGTYTLTIKNAGGVHETAGLTGDLNLTSTSHHWIIQGAGASTIIDASQLDDRVFQIVNPATQVVFKDLVIQGGLAQDDGSEGALAGTTDALGGGIFNNGGDVTLDDVVLQNNVARGGDAGFAGHPAFGGGFYSTGGALTMAGATLANNQAVGGAAGTFYDGGSAGGGGLYTSGGSLDIFDSSIASNYAAGGRGGDGTFSHIGGYGGRGQGGGLYVNGGSHTIATSSIASNQAVGGLSGFYGQCGAGQGGGLFAGGMLTLSDSTLLGNSSTSGNSSSGGGGIYNTGILTVSNSTLSGNSATYGGGGISANNGLVTLTNTTVTANRAKGGGGNYHGGGMLVSFGSPVLHNTLIAGNFRGVTGTTADDVYGSLNPGGDYNLIGDGTGMTGLVNGVNGNQVGSASNPIDPQLGPLAYNGGPTLTHGLLGGSPAIDAGNNAYATDWDQRGPGYPRIVNGIIDIGAFEYQGDGSGPAILAVPPSLVPLGMGQSAVLSSAVSATRTPIPSEADPGMTGPGSDAEGSFVDRTFVSHQENDGWRMETWWDHLDIGEPGPLLVSQP
jgi:hypothetical protein